VETDRLLILGAVTIDASNQATPTETIEGNFFPLQISGIMNLALY
jgi:hypothetical protein